MVQKSSRYLPPFNPSAHQNLNEYPNQQLQEEEFNECDVVWSTSSDSTEETTTTTVAASEIPAISITATPGISAALLSFNEPHSPTSIQRKTTSSPVSMISSSLSRSDGPGLAGYYYGRKFHQSAPLNVPVWPNGLGTGKSRPFIGLGPFDEEDDEEQMVPPHEIVARSHKATSFSVMEGAGRTLKGRDLTAVRNAVFQTTGFL